MNTDYAETQAYGVTQRSTKFVKEHLPKLGSIVQIQCLLAGNTHLEFGDEQWVAFVDEHSDRIVVSGFSWGYAGEGPHGLLNMAQELGFNLDMELIAHYPKSEYWTIYRERLQLTEDLARYIIVLQGVYDMEAGLGEEDYRIRDGLEREFPVLKDERENDEFRNWFWSVRLEEEPDVIEARSLLGHDIPFDQIYWADSKANRGVIVDPNEPGGTYDLYSQHTDVAGQIFRATKEAADAKLWAQHKAGDIDLKAEWRKQPSSMTPA